MASSNKNLEHLRQVLMDSTNGEQWFTRANNILVTAIRDDYAEGTLDVTESSMDPTGCVHKGCLATLMDNTAAMAAAGSGRHCVTLNCENHFLEPVREPCRLIGEAHLISFDNPIYVYRTAVRRENELVAIGTYTFYLLEELKESWLNER